MRQHLLATLLLVATIGVQAQDTKSVLGDSLDYAVLMVYGGTSEDSATDDEEVVLVGHGRDGAANDVYCLADYILQHEGHANCHVGTISGYPSLDNIKHILKERNAKKVVLAPLLMVAAGHATKDIYKTWREALEAEGYEVRVVRQAALEYPEIRELVIQKIIKTIEEP